MKKLMLFLLTATMAAAGFAAEGRFDVRNIRFFFRPTPVPKYENETSRSKTARSTSWLCMETTFIPEMQNARSEQWYDDVTMEGLLVIARTEGSGNSYIVLSGTTRFFTIPADGKKHVGTFFVPSKILARYLGSKNGEPVVQMARVSFYAPGKVLLGEGFWALSSARKGKFVPASSREYRAVAARMQEYEKNYSNVTMLRGGLYSKEKTPWVYFDYDLYDLIYDNIRPQDGANIKR